ncbi:hypothetical protein MesoLj113b_63960 [Mesorhizobium sp. 113-3-3]|nr:hypothetical protein MesoLj113b_63960 [Mesorhizobium sp. 113-3-3]BCG90731.1 hypothetical protein MesoLj113c_68410 [Mesorhizobium sp. 113-3-9]
MTPAHAHADVGGFAGIGPVDVVSIGSAASFPERPGAEQRGMIEIGLAGGLHVRVDAAVSEAALRR